jgi:hypothetical protein
MGLSGDQFLAALRAHEPELRAAGVAGLSYLPASGAVKMGFAYFGMLDELARQIEAIVQRPIGVVTEPVRKPELRREVETHGVIAF